MKVAPLHPRERERQDLLSSLKILDTELEDQYDEITRLAARICEVPISLVSFIDESRQWFKSRYGLDAEETPREMAFCAHAILEDDVFQIEDAREDERFHDNPLVTDDPRVIFYAGHPLKVGVDELPVGTLCVIDHQPKKLSDFQVDALRTLGRQVATHLNLRHQIKKVVEVMEEKEADYRHKQKFMANVSHELRTPLNSIIGFAQVLKESPEVPQGVRESVNIMHESGRHLLDLINDLLDMSKIEAEKIELVTETFQLSSFLDDLLSLFSLKAKEKGIELEGRLGDDLPQWVCYDPKRLRQVLINLMGNAIKFTERGGVELKVLCKNGSEEQGLRFEVKDTGCGMDESDLKRLVKPFEQAQPTLGGTGLGLAISEKLLKKMSSTLEVESELGRGTRFAFDLPYNPVNMESGKRKVRLTNQLTKRPKLSDTEGRRKVLLVDDIEENRLVCRAMLGALGFELLDAVDGEEAVRLFEEWTPDVILMDLIMPKMNGMEAARKIRSLSGDNPIPIIAITASFFESPESQFGPMDDFEAVLSKPFKMEDLLEILSEKVGLEFEGESTKQPVLADGVGHNELTKWIIDLDGNKRDDWLLVFERQDFGALETLMKRDGLDGALGKICKNAIQRYDLIFMIEMVGGLKGASREA